METPLVPDPTPPWYLRPLLWLTRLITGRDPLPARLLTLVPRAAFSVGVFEALTPGSGQLDARVLSVARITASRVGGCPFCLDMNAARWAKNGLQLDELRAVLDGRFDALPRREALAGQWAAALSSTPVVLAPELISALRASFSARELVTLAHAIAQVNYWTRFNQGLGVPAAGFYVDADRCALPLR
ncbi:MAG: carboxymuconolactone decarboxylase family protein [Myxococcaceae bacterium]